ncbi:MAG: hypothetical protein IT381_01820 [Deltaproteobacteria bacterium]|nr:hypothetical protein [Deltaproteobacteria bacterium]
MRALLFICVVFVASDAFASPASAPTIVDFGNDEVVGGRVASDVHICEGFGQRKRQRLIRLRENFRAEILQSIVAH